ncbi:MAG TPA: hypothetical protein VGY48_02215 [Vicinamibacterales bacterium]|nr:hypothetical protein [Vicinamibacterales bacterium]
MTSPFDDNALDRAIDDEARALTRGAPSPQFTARVLSRRAGRRGAGQSPRMGAQTVALVSLAGAAVLFLIAEVFGPAPPGRAGSLPAATGQAVLPPAASVGVGRSSQGSPAPAVVRAARAPAPAVGSTPWNAFPSDLDTFAMPPGASIAFDDITPPVLAVESIAVPDLDVIAPIAIAPIDEGARP